MRERRIFEENANTNRVHLPLLKKGKMHPVFCLQGKQKKGNPKTKKQKKTVDRKEYTIPGRQENKSRWQRMNDCMKGNILIVCYYDVVCVGSLNWCGTIAPPLAAWLEEKQLLKRPKI